MGMPISYIYRHIYTYTRYILYIKVQHPIVFFSKLSSKIRADRRAGGVRKAAGLSFATVPRSYHQNISQQNFTKCHYEQYQMSMNTKFKHL